MNPQTIKKRLSSVKNIGKMAQAFELISATKMRRALKNLMSLRSYARASFEILEQLGLRSGLYFHPFFKKRSLEKSFIVVISSNRGLAGAFNSRIVSKALALALDNKNNGIKSSFVTFGKKGAKLLARHSFLIAADFAKNDITSDLAKIMPLANFILKSWLEGLCDKVELVYSNFVSALRQNVEVKSLLPLSSLKSGQKFKDILYSFEPSPEKVLEYLVPRLIQIQIYSAVLENEASEHSSRMIAMKNAKEASLDLLFELELLFNKMRQENITRELLEITSAKTMNYGQ